MANSIDRRFDILKQKAAQDVRKQTQESEQGLKRQFSRLGGIGTGAFVKQQQLAKEAGSRRLQEAEQGIEFQRLGEQQRQEDITAQRAFQTSERMGSQQFATGERMGSQKFSAGQLGKQQAFATSERLGAQEFSADQSAILRKFTTGERVSAQEFQQLQFTAQNKIANDQLQVAQATLGMENNVNFLNARLQVAEGIKKGLFGQDDMDALAGMFYPGPKGFSSLGGQGGQGGQGAPRSGSATKATLANLNKVRREIDKYGGVFGKQPAKDLAHKLGITDDELRRAGII